MPFFNLLTTLKLSKIRLKQIGLLYLFGFLYLSSHSALAASLDITPTLYHFKYQEFDTGDQLLDTEKGLLPGITLALTPDYQNSLLSTHLSFFSGTVDYDGQTQSGQAHTTETNEQLISLGVTINPGSSSSATNKPFFGIQYWHWDRDIQSTSGVQGLHEIYTWTELEMGLKFEWPNHGSSGYWLAVSVLFPLNPEMELELASSKANFDLGSKPGLRIRGGKNWQLTSDLAGSLNLFTEHREFGRSDIVFTDDFFGQSASLVEPRSESRHWGLELFFKYQF